MNKIDKIDEKLQKESKRMFQFFQKCFHENNDSNNVADLNLFLKYCYIDIIPPNLLSSYIRNDSVDMLDDTDFFLEKYFDRLFEQSRNIENVQQELIQTVKAKVKYFQDNIKVCDKLISNIKKTYTRFVISEFVPNSENVKMDFMTFLPPTNSDNIKLKLGELFSRYFFSYMLVVSDPSSTQYNLNNSHTANQSVPEVFYDKNVWESFLQKDSHEIVSMPSMDKRFSFWILYLLLVGNLFGKDSSKLSLFYHYPALEKYIKKIFTGQQQQQKQQHPQKQQHFDNRKGHQERDYRGNRYNKQDRIKQNKFFGGAENNYIEKMLRKELQKKQEQKKKSKEQQFKNSPEKKFVLETMKLFVNDKTLYNRIYLVFENTIRWDYLYPYIQNNLVENGMIQLDKKFPHPFFPKDEFSQIKLSDFMNKKKNDKREKSVPEQGVKSLMNQIKFDIFQSLKMYDNDENEKFIFDFYNVFKKTFLYLLYFITDTKKRIYEKYIEISKDKIDDFVFRMNHENNNLNKNLNLQTMNNVKQERKQARNNERKIVMNNQYNMKQNQVNKKAQNYSELKPNIRNQVIYIDKKITLIQKKIIELEKEKGTINYERKRIELEKMIREAYIEKNKLLLKGSE